VIVTRAKGVPVSEFQRRVVIAAITAATFNQAMPAAAADGQATQAQNPGDEIIVTGTRRTARTAAESLAPIDVIDARQLGASPSSDLNDKLAATVPSFNVQREPGSDGAIFSRPASLRNLSPDQTLVLVNGHRRHRSAFVDVVNQGSEAVDLAQIPAASIGRIEVLRDGASAQYGSDAIAGVINIILDDTPGTVLTAQAGQYYAGDGFGLQLSGRSGMKLPGGGSLTIAGDYNNSNATDRSVGIKYKLGQPELESYHVTYDLKLPLNDSLNLYSFGSYGRTTGWNQFSYRSAANGDAVFGRSFYQDGANAIYPAYSLSSIYPNGFIPEFGPIIKDVDGVVGVKGEIVDNLTLDVSGGYGRNSIDYKVRNSVNASLGPLSPTRFDAGRLVASEGSLNADASYLIDVGLAKPVSMAFGGEYRHERYESVAGDVASYEVGPLSDLPAGASGFPGLPPASAGTSSRNSEAAYFDVEADLTNRLTFGAAGRYEHFSDFGSNFSYKFSGRYRLSDVIALRATYSTGFHAPALGQQHFTKLSTALDPTAPPPYPIIQIGLVSPSDPLAVAFGGKALKPETSRNISAGIVLQPASGLTITADYYHIKIDDRIGITPQLSLPAGSIYNRIQFLINGYDTKSDGVDIVASWTHRLGAGHFGLTGAYNYNRTKISRFDPIVVNNVSRPYIEDARPHHTAIFTATYDIGSLHLLGRTRYFGSWVDAVPFDQSALGFNNQKVSPRAFVDLSVSYDVTSNTQLTVGAENVLDTYPDKVTSVLQYIGFKYPFLRPYDEDGGRWYVRVTQRL
jgi:iron complex outermembrane receptor protein